MPRKYDRIIRFYDSWFDDLSDPSKELSADEQLQIIRAIRDAQVMATSEPIRNLPLQIRRCLSVATLCEQIERMCERSERMRSRGRAGGLAAAQHAALPDCDDDDDDELITSAPNDGLEHNINAFSESFEKWGFTNKQRNDIIRRSNFMQIGHPVMRILYTAQSKRDPKAWLSVALKTQF